MVFKGTTGAYKPVCLEKEKYPKYIIRAEFYQFSTSLPIAMRSLIVVQQRFENEYGV